MKKQNIHKHLMQPSISFSAFNYMFTSEEFKTGLAALVVKHRHDVKIKQIYEIIKASNLNNFLDFEDMMRQQHENLSVKFSEISKQVVSNLVAQKYGQEMVLLEEQPGKFQTYLTGSGKFMTICDEEPREFGGVSEGSLLDKLLALLLSQVKSKNNHTELRYFRNDGKTIIASNLAGYHELQLKLDRHAHAHQETILSEFIKHDYENLREFVQKLMIVCHKQSLDGQDLIEVVFKALNKDHLLHETVMVKDGTDFNQTTMSDFIKNYGYDTKTNHFYHIDNSTKGIKHKMMFAASREPKNYHTIFFPGDHGYKKLLKHNLPKKRN